MPGVEIHAQLIEAALTNAILSYPNYAIGAELIAAFLVGIAIVILAPMIGALPLLILGAGVGAGLAAISWMVFQQQNILIDVTFPLMSSFGVYAALVFVNYLREQVDRQRIRSAFGQYLSPTLVEQLAQNPDKLVLGGEERTMTIMFSDVRGFTTISESFKDDPQGLTNLMNRLLTPMSNAIQARNGTIDKYMGDAIMAFWNAPLDDPNHEANACDAALDMLERLDALNAERKQDAEASGKPFIPIKIGIGINTGRVTVGNMGSDMRFQYTVLGDSVNLASRIEGQTKSYGVPILIGARTAQAIKDKFADRRDRFHHRQRQDRARGRLHGAGAQGDGRVDRVRRRAGVDAPVARALPGAGLARRHQGGAGVPGRQRPVSSRRRRRPLRGAHSGVRTKPAAARLERGVRAADEVTGALVSRSRPEQPPTLISPRHPEELDRLGPRGRRSRRHGKRRGRPPLAILRDAASRAHLADEAVFEQRATYALSGRSCSTWFCRREMLSNRRAVASRRKKKPNSGFWK